MRRQRTLSHQCGAADAPELGLTRELRLGEDAHVDDVPAPHAVHPALRAGRELRALHAHDALAAVHARRVPARGALLLRGALEHGVDAALEPAHEAQRERLPERGVRDDAGALEEARGAHALGAVDDLRRKDEVAGRELLLERADGGEREYGPDAERFERCDVGLRRHGGRRDSVSHAVASEEGDFGARREGTDRYRRAREAPGLEATD